MVPERRRVSAAPWGRRPDSGPRGTNILQGLIQGARPPFFCFPLLPRVLAADVDAAQPAQTLSSSSSSSTSAAPPPAPSPSRLPVNIGRPELPASGWERVKELFDRDETLSYPEELVNLVTHGVAGGIFGFVYGGVPAARHARQRYIQVSQAEMYTSQVDAMRSSHNAAIRGFVRYGWRWSWRVAVIITLVNSVNTGLSVYRDKDAISNYIAAGAVTGGLFRVNLGLRGLLAGGVIGSVLGIPFGAAILGLQSLTGESVRDRRRRERRELYEHKLAEWTARLQLTDELISSLSSGCQVDDMQRIEELLSLPPNQEAPTDSSSQSQPPSDR